MNKTIGWLLFHAYPTNLTPGQWDRMSDGLKSTYDKWAENFSKNLQEVDLKVPNQDEQTDDATGIPTIQENLK